MNCVNDGFSKITFGSGTKLIVHSSELFYDLLFIHDFVPTNNIKSICPYTIHTHLHYTIYTIILK